MKIRLKSIGDLRDYFGREPQEIELPENAVMGDLFPVIEERWGTILPAYLWDREKQRFKGAVVLLVDKRVIHDFKAPLNDGMEVQILKAIAGG
jgi:molybdopterin converting factor small subunit